MIRQMMNHNGANLNIYISSCDSFNNLNWWWIQNISHVERVRVTKDPFVNTLRPRQNEQHFADDIFKRIFFNENVWISIKISLKLVPKDPINNIPALVQIIAWRRSGDKPLSEPMMASLPTHIRVTRPQWVNSIIFLLSFFFQRNVWHPNSFLDISKQFLLEIMP